MITHPPAHRLDAIAAGESDEVDAEHIAHCEPCTLYVEQLRQEIARESAKFPSDALFAALASKTLAEKAEKSAQQERTATTAPAIAFPTASEREERGAKSKKFDQRIRGLAKSWNYAAMLAAAGILLFVGISTQTGLSKGDHITSKGSAGLAVVVDHGAAQERVTSDVAVSAGDKFVLELSVPERGRYEAGILAEDGSWTTLFGPKDCEPGSFLTPTAARVDKDGIRGRIVFGKEEDIVKVKLTKSTAGVTALRVRMKE